MKNLYAMLLVLTLSANATEVSQLIDLVMQRELMMQSMKDVFAQTLRGQVNEQDGVAKELADKFLEKFDSKTVKEELVSIFRKHFTGEEISAMLKFYSTEVGKKAIELMPEVMNEASQVTIRSVQEVISDTIPE